MAHAQIMNRPIINLLYLCTYIHICIYIYIYIYILPSLTFPKCGTSRRENLAASITIRDLIHSVTTITFLRFSFSFSCSSIPSIYRQIRLSHCNIDHCLAFTILLSQSSKPSEFLQGAGVVAASIWLLFPFFGSAFDFLYHVSTLSQRLIMRLCYN